MLQLWGDLMYPVLVRSVLLVNFVNIHFTDITKYHLVGKQGEWEPGASSSPTVEDKDGLISHIRSPILVMSGRSHLLVLPTQKALSLKKCENFP